MCNVRSQRWWARFTGGTRTAQIASKVAKKVPNPQTELHKFLDGYFHFLYNKCWSPLMPLGLFVMTNSFDYSPPFSFV